MLPDRLPPIPGLAALLRPVQLEVSASHALMMAGRKHKNIVQWSCRQVPLNVVVRIPLYGYSRS
jgi:hypothetical protein